MNPSANTSVTTAGKTSGQAQGALPTTDPALEDALRDGLDAVEVRLRHAVSTTDPIADAPARHLVEAGGKRVRPMLTLLGAHLAAPGSAVVADEVLEAAVVCELTHLASLYHDDVMDSAPTRRGAPAAQQLYGNNTAILIGDLLFARASNVVAALGPEAVLLQAATFERLCLGQLHETVGPRPDEDPVRHYLDVLSDKTASLIATAGRFGALFAGGSEDVVQAMVRYGEDVGVAFQLADDVLDLASDTDESGKRPGPTCARASRRCPCCSPAAPPPRATRTRAPSSTSWTPVASPTTTSSPRPSPPCGPTPSPRPPAPPRASGRTAPPPTSPSCRPRPRARRSRRTPPRSPTAWSEHRSRGVPAGRDVGQLGTVPDAVTPVRRPPTGVTTWTHVRVSPRRRPDGVGTPTAHPRGDTDGCPVSEDGLSPSAARPSRRPAPRPRAASAAPRPRAR